MRCVMILMLGLVAASCASGAPATAPATAPAGLSSDSSIDDLLTALRDVGRDLKDFTADVSMAETNEVTGDSATRRGTVWYQLRSPGDARIRVDFPIRQVDKDIFKDQRIEYMLDAGILWDRDYKRKVQVKRQVLQPGQKLNLLKLGEGPFPLPIGQEPADVRKQFEIEKPPSAAGPLAQLVGVVHARLTPREGGEMAKRYKRIDVWVDAVSRFPRRIETLDKPGLRTSTVDLKLRGMNTGLGDRDFALEPIDDKTWTQRTEAFKP